MTEPLYRFSPEALSYLGEHANEINFVAGSLDISPLSVAAGIAREQTLVSYYYNAQLKHILGDPTVKSALLSYLQTLSDNNLRSIYENTNKLDPETLMYPGASAMRHPMLFDAGPGNIKLRTAISLLDNYNAQFKGNDDFLDLNKYNGNLPRFITDVRDPDSPLTANLAGLLASEATQFYQRHMTPTGWNYLTDDQKAAAITQYYVRGPEKLTQEARGQEFWFPDFSKPGSSFYDYKDNADVLRAALEHRTLPPEPTAPQPDIETISSSDQSPYAYVSVSNALPANDLAMYAQQPQTVLPAGSTLNAYRPLASPSFPKAPAQASGNAFIPGPYAPAADANLAAALDNIALMRLFAGGPANPLAQP